MDTGGGAGAGSPAPEQPRQATGRSRLLADGPPRVPPARVVTLLPWSANLSRGPSTGSARRVVGGRGRGGWLPAAQARSWGSSTSENFRRVGGSNCAKARRIGSSTGVGQKYQMPS